VAAEVTRDRNQKAESAEEGGKQSWVHEINDGDFRLVVRPAAPSKSPIPTVLRAAVTVDVDQDREP
jgi:hypothetical protein